MSSGEHAMPVEASVEATTSAPKKRLVITKLVLENFKSYAGEVTVGLFHKVSSGFFRGERRLLLQH